MEASRLMLYNKEHFDERESVPLAEALQLAKDPQRVGWVTLYDPTEADYLLLEQVLGLHPLALEDTRNQRQRPKVEEFPDHTYVVVRSLRRSEEGEVRSFQSNIFFSVTDQWVLVIHERPVGIFQDVRDRIRRGRPRIRMSGPDYLVYALIDAVVDTYFPLMEEIGDRIEDLEDALFAGASSRETLDHIHQLKSDLRRIRRTVWPARDAMGHLNREETRGFKKSTMPFLRDVQDHIIQALDMTENHREATSGLMDLYLNTVSNRMNEIMKVLTMVATIFIPLTFVAGIYGMNFDTDQPGNMPELTWPYAYVGFWVLSAVIVVAMVLFFRRKGWFG